MFSTYGFLIADVRFFSFFLHSKSCYTGYPKKNFPTKSMQARATPLPDKTKTFTIQVDNGTTHVFVADGGTHAPSVKKLVSRERHFFLPDVVHRTVRTEEKTLSIGAQTNISWPKRGDQIALRSLFARRHVMAPPFHPTLTFFLGIAVPA